jgi:hypothetical protein
MILIMPGDDDKYSDEEAIRRMNEALRRALTSPPKPHKEMRIGKRKAKASTKADPPQKRGRPKNPGQQSG